MSSNRQPGHLAKKAYAGFFWQMLGFSLNTVLSVAHIVIMARLLSPEIFGQFAIAGIIIAITMIVSEFGLGPALVQKSSITDEDITFVFFLNLLIGFVLFLIIVLLSGPISHFFNNAVSPEIIMVLALCLLAQPIGLASKSLLLRKMDFQSIFVATNLSYFIGMLLVGIPLALLGYGIWSLIVGFIATKAVASLYFLYKSRIPFSFKTANTDTRYLLRYGAGLTTVQAVNQLSLIADKLILSQLATNTTLGLYERSQRIQQMPGVFMGGVLDTVLFSTLSKFSDDKPKLGTHFFNFVTVGVLIGAYLSVLLFTFAEVIVLVMLGQNWTEAIVVLQLLAVLVGFQLLSRLGDTYIRASGEFNKSIRVKVCYLFLVFILAYIGYQIMQIEGAILGIVIASIMHTVLLMFVCQKDSEYETNELWQRVKPGLVLAGILLIKNLLILQVLSATSWLTIVVVLASDALVIFLLFRSTFFLHGKNRQFIYTRFTELSQLLKTRLSY